MEKRPNEEDLFGNKEDYGPSHLGLLSIMLETNFQRRTMARPT